MKPKACNRDREWAKRIVRIFKLDGNILTFQDYQSPQRDPLRNMRFFRRYIKDSSEATRKRMNREATKSRDKLLTT